MGSASILIVEDEAIIAADLANQLTRLGYEVIGSLDRGEDAIDVAKRQRPSLVMMDIRLAGALNGIESAIAIRRETQLPVMFLTAHCDAATLHCAAQSGACGYILKPFEARELHVSIEMALHKHAAEHMLRSEKEQMEGRVLATERALDRKQEELRSLLQSLITAEENACQRVSRDLHDDLGQQVALLEHSAARLEQKYEQDPGAIPFELSEMRKQTAQLSQDLHAVAFQLHPTILDDLGLAMALKRLVEAFAQDAGMPVEFHADDLPGMISTQTAKALYRITQEALRNTAKHAGKTQLAVTLSARDQVLRLQIRDSGKGFDPLAVRPRGRMGIFNMEERARLAGGRLTLDTRPGDGVAITVEVPLAGRSAPAVESPLAGRPARLLLVDDHRMFLEGMRRLLAPEFEIAGTLESGYDLVRTAETLRPDVILLDISMPILNGFDAARQLAQRGLQSKLIFVSMYEDPDYVREAFRAGASGYLLKRGAFDELVPAIRRVLNHEQYLTPLIKVDALQSAGPGKKTAELTGRQRQILQLIGEGHAGKAIAALLSISPKTVEYHKACIMNLLGLRSTAELTRYAMRHGLIPKD